MDLWIFEVYSKTLLLNPYNDKSGISMAAILKRKQVPCTRRNEFLTIFKYSFLFHRYSSFQNVKISQEMTSSIMKNDISANLPQKCMICCSKIRNFSLTVFFLPWQHTGFQTSLILKAFLAFPFGVPFSYLQMVPHIQLFQQTYKYVSVRLWPCLTFWELKVTYRLKSSGWGMERVSCLRKKMFYSRGCVFCRTISLPSFNGLRCKLAKIAPFKYLRNLCIYLQTVNGVFVLIYIEFYVIRVKVGHRSTLNTLSQGYCC